MIPLATLRALRAVADAAGVALHCDGARIWHAHVADGVPLATYGAAVRHAVGLPVQGAGRAGRLAGRVGSAERIAKARWIRKRMGGGMRQAGILAAAGLYALRPPHRAAGRGPRAGAPAGRGAGAVRRAWTSTGCAPTSCRSTCAKAALDAPALARRRASSGVLVSVLGPRTARLVTHLDVDDAGVDRAAEALPALFRA